jgi:hypothetical protein
MRMKRLAQGSVSSTDWGKMPRPASLQGGRLLLEPRQCLYEPTACDSIIRMQRTSNADANLSTRELASVHRLVDGVDCAPSRGGGLNDPAQLSYGPTDFVLWQALRSPPHAPLRPCLRVRCERKILRIFPEEKSIGESKIAPSDARIWHLPITHHKLGARRGTGDEASVRKMADLRPPSDSEYP